MVRNTTYLTACAIFLTSLIGDVSGQNSQAGIDPFAVQKRVVDNPQFDVASLWRSLGITAQLDTVNRNTTGDRLDSSTTFADCSDECVAEVTRANVDFDPAEEVILKLYRRWEICRFLVFKRIGNPTEGAVQWRFLGHADHDFARTYMPEYRVESLAGRRYFVMAAQGASGTGVSLQYERWYEIGSNGMHEILSLPAKGSECSDLRSLCREFGSKVLARNDIPHAEQFLLSFTVRYTGNSFLMNERTTRNLTLLSRSQRAVYVRARNSDNYVLSEQGSEITTREIQSVFNIDTLTCNDFLTFNINDLVRRASDAENIIKEWPRKLRSAMRALSRESQVTSTAA